MKCMELLSYKGLALELTSFSFSFSFFSKLEYVIFSFARRTRAAFDVALKVHQNIQQRDLEVGRNLGNWILRWLDKMKPSAQIRVPTHHDAGNAKTNIPKQTNSSSLKTPRSIQTPRNGEADRHLFISSTNTWSKSFPTIAMMRPPRASGNMTQYRHLSINGSDISRLNYARGEGVIRKDILQWLLQKWRWKLFSVSIGGLSKLWVFGERVNLDALRLLFWKDTFLWMLQNLLKAFPWDNKFSFSSAFCIFFWVSISQLSVARGTQIVLLF